MYENITYEALLKRMLATALAENPGIDTREGSIVWLGQAPAAAELQNIYIELDDILDETFADTASRNNLIRRAAERGITPHPATRMTGQGEFTPISLEIRAGTRFSLNDLNYTVTQKLGEGVYKLECETAGEIGNEYTGELIPIEYVAGLETARLTKILIPGEDEEDTESIRARYFDSLKAQAFGGNAADYREKVNAISGVGGVKVYRAWNGGIKPADIVPPADMEDWLTDSVMPDNIRVWITKVYEAAKSSLISVGGTVRLVIIDSTYSKPSELLVDTVQTIIDPAQNHAEGVGIAPIGHIVTVEGVGSTEVNIMTCVTLQEGWTWADVEKHAQAVVDEYFKDLAASWANAADPLVVRISQIETRLLTCPGVVDIADTTINGVGSNLVLGDDNIPVRGELVG